MMQSCTEMRRQVVASLDNQTKSLNIRAELNPSVDNQNLDLELVCVSELVCC